MYVCVPVAGWGVRGGPKLGLGERERGQLRLTVWIRLNVGDLHQPVGSGRAGWARRLLVEVPLMILVLYHLSRLVRVKPLRDGPPGQRERVLVAAG